MEVIDWQSTRRSDWAGHGPSLCCLVYFRTRRVRSVLRYSRMSHVECWISILRIKIKDFARFTLLCVIGCAKSVPPSNDINLRHTTYRRPGFITVRSVAPSPSSATPNFYFYFALIIPLPFVKELRQSWVRRYLKRCHETFDVIAPLTERYLRAFASTRGSTCDRFYRRSTCRR